MAGCGNGLGYRASLPFHLYMKALFIRTDRMGDALMNLPAIRLLRQTYPKAWITLLLDSPLKGLLDGHPDLDEILYLDAGRFKKSFGYRLEWIARLRKIGFDLVVVSNPDRFLHATVFFAGIPERIGYRRKWPFFLTRRLPDDKGAVRRHEFESNLNLLKRTGSPDWDGNWDLPVDALAAERVKEKIAAAGIGDLGCVAVHAGTSNAKKRWPAKKFGALCARIEHELFRRVVLIGGGEEKSAALEVARASGLPLIDWAGQLSLQELVAFLSSERVEAFVSSDSGPAHVAWLGGTPGVIFFARNCEGSDPARWGPQDGKSEFIFKDISDISVEEVFTALKRVLEK